VALHILAETTGGGYVLADTSSASGPFEIFGSSGYFNEIPDSRSFIESQYEFVGDKSRYPEEYDEVLLIVDEKNRVNSNFIEEYGIDFQEDYSTEDFIGMEFMVVDNDDYFKKAGSVFTTGTDYRAMAESEKTIRIRITGIMKLKESATSDILPTGIGYTTMLTEKAISRAMGSQIVSEQRENPEMNILTGRTFPDRDSYGEVMKYLGGDSTPTAIQIYPVSFEAKDGIKAHLDDYNSGRDDNDKIIYSDLAETISWTIAGLINTITVILSAFAAISLVVSSIMIGIITYVSVVERTKEIGILRSIGARKKDISRVFIAESVIIGFTAGVIGVILATLLVFPINAIIERAVDAKNFASLPEAGAAALVGISVALTFVAGLIPSKIAANKDPVAALRTE
jgi:putative ABC transport system permease protein